MTAGHEPMAPARRQTALDVVASEWLKVWTVRSTWWTLAAALVLSVGFGVLLTAAVAATWEVADGPFTAGESVATALSGMLFGELILAVFGVLFITSEYSTGGIHTTLSSVPRRWLVVVAKGLVVAVVALVAGAIIVLAAFFAGQAVLASQGLAVGLGDPGVARAVGGSVLYVGAVALFGLGVGFIIRNSGGGITAAIVGLIVLPSLVTVLPGALGTTVGKFVTSNAGRPITAVDTSPGSLDPWAGYGVFVLWGIGLLAIGALLLGRRDA